LQDRLVKELTLKGISSIEAANLYLVEYVKKHNAKFAVEALDAEDAHKEVLLSQKPDEILCYKAERKLTKNLELSYEGRILQITTDRPSYAMRGAKVEIIESLKGEVRIKYHGKELDYKELLVKDHQGRIINRKTLTSGAALPSKRIRT
ncbi:hypothetical protein COB11_07420, partial [Candidatus Aerophobetes bacterium]